MTTPAGLPGKGVGREAERLRAAVALATELLGYLPDWPGHDQWERRLAALSSPETTPAGVLDEAALREVLTAVRGILDQHVLRLIRYYDLRQTHIETFTFEAIAEIDAALAAQPQPGEPTP